MTRFWPFAVRVFQSTPSARRATIAKIREQDTDSISIHALREESDPSKWRSTFTLTCISIHAFREEGDVTETLTDGTTKQFQSTPSARRATKSAGSVTGAPDDFNPRPPRGGRQQSAGGDRRQNYFNPRPPRGGRLYD